jgi:hypothetical protein
MRPVLRDLLLLLLDALLILLFAFIGRRSHEEGSAVLAVLVTAWPFLTGMAAGWLVSLLAFRTFPRTVRHGIPVWLCTVAGGMLLRQTTGKGIAPSFVVVATFVLGAFLLGWRALAAWLDRWEGPRHG